MSRGIVFSLPINPKSDGEFVKNTESAVSKSSARQMIRAMYFDKISSSMFNEIVKNAGDSFKSNKLAAGFFKYVRRR